MELHPVTFSRPTLLLEPLEVAAAFAGVERALGQVQAALAELQRVLEPPRERELPCGCPPGECAAAEAGEPRCRR